MAKGPRQKKKKKIPLNTSMRGHTEKPRIWKNMDSSNKVNSQNHLEFSVKRSKDTNKMSVGR